ncbi:GNAT family N-acetyltransferase [Arcobacter cryaerophilus gv. occultus]|uniref:GNAT family N-acetyltransferase n=1 Tax=Aliarcobacter cryaerophilus TaxID=28198 RepID=UPI000D01A092|nr:GNAT family N-acetyltransferase [Aliarcobacter cryaerophilus]PRM91335.1 GNAT family N-acetyltransferase [Arcobacter cryaerophilus gv. occultus]
MNITKYTVEYKSLWNEFVKNSKNGHFFFQRDYMEYHSDRFEDFSLMFFDETDKLIAILPANIKEDILYSHQGLTFGGFLVDDRMKTETMLEIFESLKHFLKEQNIKKIVYKCIPYIYHLKPSEEDRYALFRNDAKLIRRDVTSTIDLTEQVRYSKGRKWTINKAKKESIETFESNDYEIFWELLTGVLESNHEAKPVHTLEEIKKLANLFPKNIRLFLAKKDEKIVSGALIYENQNIVHTQYLANSEEGRETGALDLLIDYLIKDIYKNKKYFDFGISNEDAGRYLNTGLIAQKEGFGARAVVHDFYELEIK